MELIASEPTVTAAFEVIIQLTPLRFHATHIPYLNLHS